ncbi:hypothetical protein HYFRA_00005691 [Hymenoscyphus fraxineus]|uniref:Uncharacterized protein n=1 Tax=Hymenoscyphus fraxineus TaxID=746836 RepID=A0A9N9KTT7_9HELO|nr:hypothetical protein HYFRA_00005691 [Hymenoscyphus fraxineus]
MAGGVGGQRILGLSRMTKTAATRSGELSQSEENDQSRRYLSSVVEAEHGPGRWSRCVHSADSSEGVGETTVADGRWRCSTTSEHAWK